MDQHKQIKTHAKKEKFKPDNNPKFENHTLISGESNMAIPYLFSLCEQSGSLWWIFAKNFKAHLGIQLLKEPSIYELPPKYNAWKGKQTSQPSKDPKFKRTTHKQ